MSKERIIVNIFWDDNYGASSNQIPGCVATHKTLEGVKEFFESAVEFHIEGSRPDELPECLKNEYEFDYLLDVSALLHFYDGIITRAALSRVTGINERQLGHYMTGYRHPKPDKREKIVNGLHKIGEEFLAVR